MLRHTTRRDTVEFGVNAGVAGVTFGAKSTAKVVTTVVPVGGGTDNGTGADHGGMSAAEIAEMEKEEEAQAQGEAFRGRRECSGGPAAPVRAECACRTRRSRAPQ